VKINKRILLEILNEILALIEINAMGHINFGAILARFIDSRHFLGSEMARYWVQNVLD
jgi:hypothetical protein